VSLRCVLICNELLPVVMPQVEELDAELSELERHTFLSLRLVLICNKSCPCDAAG
jgi:hypothetical protein